MQLEVWGAGHRLAQAFPYTKAEGNSEMSRGADAERPGGMLVRWAGADWAGCGVRTEEELGGQGGGDLPDPSGMEKEACK
jgi:hypothetical protein